MRRHTVTEKDLDAWLRVPRWQEFAGSFGDYSNKSFEINATNEGGGLVFRVVDHGKTVFLGDDRKAAVAAYNNAP